MKKINPIKAALDEQGRSVTYLSKITGIEYQKLSKILREDMVKMKINIFWELCEALKLDPLKLINKSKGE